MKPLAGRLLVVAALTAAATPSAIAAQPVTDMLGLNSLLNSLWPLQRWNEWAFVAAGLVFWRQRRTGLLLACLLLRVLPEALNALANYVLWFPLSRQAIVNISQLKQLLSLCVWPLLAYAVVASLRGAQSANPPPQEQ